MGTVPLTGNNWESRGMRLEWEGGGGGGRWREGGCRGAYFRLQIAQAFGD